MPDGDFFWNECRTYTAFSNRTVYTARYAFPSWDSTTSSTPGPSPFHGFAVGAVPPNCAMPRALPMSSLTAAGKLKTSRLDDPTQCSGLSSAARTRRTARLSPFWDISASAGRHRLPIFRASPEEPPRRRRQEPESGWELPVHKRPSLPAPERVPDVCYRRGTKYRNPRNTRGRSHRL